MMDWQLPDPHIEIWQITDSHIDHYGHANNVAYIAQQELVAWAHSNALGLSMDDYHALDRAMVVQSHQVKYIQPCNLNDQVHCATWITECKNKLTLTRNFQYICSRRKTTVYEAQTVFVCIKLSSGKPIRMPPRFWDVYSRAHVGVKA